MESFKELQTKFFAGELTEAQITKVMKALENLYIEESKQEEPKPSVKQIGTCPTTIDPGVLPVSVDKGLLPLSTDPGALPVTKATVVLPETTKSGMEELALKPTKFYVDKLNISPGDIAKTRKRYLELGQYDYEGEEYLENFGEKIDTNTSGLKYHYIGHFKKGTNERDGIGISVTENGYIYEGYYKNDKIHGTGRLIWPDGRYLIGGWKDGKTEGYAEFYMDDGKIYKGQWKDSKWDGKGTLFYADGNTKTGEFKENKFVK